MVHISCPSIITFLNVYFSETLSFALLLTNKIEKCYISIIESLGKYGFMTYECNLLFICLMVNRYILVKLVSFLATP